MVIALRQKTLGQAGTLSAEALPEYRPRSPESTVLHGVVREHLETFLADAACQGGAVPEMVERELRDFLTCGALARGFARVRCTECGTERLVAFSCKGRGFCPSCMGRRMTELSAHLVDDVIPRVRVRQWVLSLPVPLRYVLAWNHDLCLAVLAVFFRALSSDLRRRAGLAGVQDGRSGAVTVIQRFGGALNLNVHFHNLAADGVFVLGRDRNVAFHEAPPPTDDDVARLVETVRTRVSRLLLRRGVGLPDGEGVADPLADAEPLLSGLYQAGVQGRAALPPRSGLRPRRIGAPQGQMTPSSRSPLQAHIDGFDLHAGVCIDARTERDRLERLCRYVLRPPISDDRLEQLPNGDLKVELRSPWTDGTTHLILTPIELLERLAALVPRPTSPSRSSRRSLGEGGPRSLRAERQLATRGRDLRRTASAGGRRRQRAAFAATVEAALLAVG